MDYRFLRFPGGKAKAVTFSYDDGRRQDIRLANTLTSRGIKCTFNINSGRFGATADDSYLTARELRECVLDQGHEIAVHGRRHMAPGLSRPVDALWDILSCRRELEQEFGILCRGMAYPDSGITNMQNGASYGRIRQYLQDMDIVYARTLGGDNNRFRLPEDWYAWMPTAHHCNPRVLDYAREFVELDPDEADRYPATRFPRLFYLWGHSYEFDRDGNWARLDGICDILAGREDTWYATNMEIFEYVQAWDRLVFSADATRVYNPSLIPVWLRTDTAAFCVAPGQTLELK